MKISGEGKIGASKKLRNRNIVVALFFLFGFLILSLAGLLMFNFGFFEDHNPERFYIEDQCALIMGNLVHQVRDNAECRIKCVNECDVREMNFVNFTFEGKNDDCNYCECWCK